MNIYKRKIIYEYVWRNLFFEENIRNFSDIEYYIKFLWK